MNASYKIVLLGVFVLFAAVIGFVIFSGGDDKPDDFTLNDETHEQDTQQQKPEPTPAIEEPEPAPEPEPRSPRPTLETPVIEQPAVVEEETIGETPDELPEAPIFGRFPEGTLAEADPLSETIRPAPELVEQPITEDPGTRTETEVEPRPAPTPETVDPIEETTDPDPEPVVEPSPRPIPPDPASIPRTYTVQTGDTFASIAEEFYGEERAWFDIAQANPSVDPKRLQVGQEIVLPNLDTVVREREEVQPPAPGRDQSYTVRPGDNLSKIAQRFYGEAEKWDLIYARNRQLIGPRPDALKVGMELVIPQAYDGAE